MKKFKLEQHGRLLMARAYVEGTTGIAYPKLLIDTGSAYTILSQEMLEFVGASPTAAIKRQRIITGSGYEVVPVISVRRFHCFGKDLNNYPILGHTLPHGVFVDGLLGMDFLGRFELAIYTKSAVIEV